MNTTNKVLFVTTCLLLATTVFLTLQYLKDNSSTPVSNQLNTPEPPVALTETTPDNPSEGVNEPGTNPIPTPPTEESADTTESAPTEPSSILDSPYLGSYTLGNATYGDETVVTVSGNTRTITTNTLPNHTTGDFPTSGNPNEIAAINNTYTYPLNPTFTGVAKEARNAAVGINGISFEPGTAERVTCTSGEEYRVVGLQDMLDLGMDMNNAHVQPTGLYHYHGTPTGLIEFADQGNDLVHIGFAADGFLMYYSKSGAYESGHTLSTTPRSGTSCTVSGPGNQNMTIEGTAPDGSLEEDWVYSPSKGDLDECNGITIDGQYVYIVTDEYPFVGRCLFGEYAEESRPPSGGGNGGQPPVGGEGGGSGPPPSGGRSPQL